ncbi:Pro-Pol polyprotein, partial [Mucuna pruriens]
MRGGFPGVKDDVSLSPYPHTAEEEGEQRPIYYASKVLQGVELQYQKIEKVALTIVVTARKLRPYFQSHPMICRTDLPIRQILRKPNLARRMTGWAVELLEFDMAYETRGHMKAQVLTDFINELTPNSREEEDAGDNKEWMLSIDGSSNKKGSRAWIILEGPGGVLIEQSFRFDFRASNNQAKYEALLAGIRFTKELGTRKLPVKSDSQVVTRHRSTFEWFTLLHVPREQNERVDLLAKLASTQKGGLHRIVIQEALGRPTIEETRVLCTEWRSSCLHLIINYLSQDVASDDPQETQRIKRETTKYVLIADHCIGGAFSIPLRQCLGKAKGECAIKEVLEGACGSHIGGRALANKIARVGFYLLAIKKDNLAFVKKCNKCQCYADRHQAPPEQLHSITLSWPFYMWGVDILGHFLLAIGQIKFLLVVVDYFTKWIEVEPIAMISVERVMHFYWRRIICCFGLSTIIVGDNGTQFTSREVVEFCVQYVIKQSFTFMEHPQSNEQAKATNRVILKGQCKGAMGRGTAIGALVISHHTALDTQETPFCLTFGTDAIISVEVEESSPCVVFTQCDGNEEELRENLDLL